MKQIYKTIYSAVLTVACTFGLQAQTIQIGSGVQTSGNTTASPINGYYEYMRYQTVYTAAEIAAQGVTATSNITDIAYFVTTPPAGGLPNYQIRMAHTNAADASAHIGAALTTVYSSVPGPTLTANSWNTLTFSTPFTWDGVSNVVVDVTFGLAPYVTPYGSLYTFTSTNGSRFVRCDGCGSQANVVTTNTQNTKPQTRLTFVALGGCTGTPDAGVASSPAAACSGLDFDLTLTGTTNAADVSIQWQSSADDIVYSDISGAISGTVAVSQTANTYYRAVVTCDNSGNTDTSNVVYVTMNSFLNCYCASEASSTADTKIDSVEFLTVLTGSSSSTCETYTDYTSQVATVTRGANFNLHIRNGSCSGNHYTAFVGVYIDFNQDGDLSDAGELVYSFGPTTALNTIPDGVINISNTALLGQTRMRIILAEDLSVTAPCDAYDYGETEDYTLNIVAAPPCTDPPVAGSITAPTAVCPETSVGLVLSGHTLGTQLQWETSTDGSNWLAVSGALNAVYTTDPITDTVFYRVKVTCGDSSYTSSVEIDLTPFMTCYCTDGLDGGCTDAPISNVTISGTTLNNTSGCTTTGGGDAYTAYADTGSATATLLLTVPYRLHVTTGDDAIVSIWIDYDHNGIFEDDEWTQVTLSSSNDSVWVTVPNTALLGQTGMRIRSRLTGNDNFAPDACTSFGSGETEDYIITLGPAPACAIPPVGGVVSGPSTGQGGLPYLFEVTGETGTIQWQYSATSATGPFLPILNANDDSLVAVFTAGTYWLRTYLTAPGCDPDSSNVLQVLITYPGDDVCDARSLSFGVNGPYLTLYASAQAGEPTPPGGGCSTPGNWCDSVATSSLWFTFVAPASGRVRIQSPDFDTQLALWDADSCDAILNGGATLLASNDDDPNNTLHGGVNFSSFIDSAVCLTPGRTYYVQLDPYNAPGDTTTIVLTDLGGVSVSVNSQTDVACFGLSTGAIDINVSGGSGSYSYQWSNASITQDVSGLAAGTYTVTITETGCAASVTASATIVQPTPIVPSLDSLVNVSCNGGSDGGIYVTVAGGTPPYIYAWSNGSSTEDLVNVPAGLYTGTVTDNNGCALTSPQLAITEPAILSVSVDSVTDNACSGVTTGAVYISVTGGTTAYSFSWSNSATSEDISSLAAGSYTVTVEDTQGCTASQSATVNDGAGVSVTIDSVTNNACSGLTTGAIEITAAGGTPAYTFNWSNGASVEDISALAAGTFTVTVADVSGCTASASASVNDDAGITITVDSITNNACAGLTTGAVSITASGGTPTYTFNWSNGASSEDISALAAGTFTVSVQDAVGCSATQSALVADNSSIGISIDSVTDNACNGLTTGAIEITVTGGTPTYNYLWNSGATSEDVNNLAAGTYTVTVDDASGCSASASAAVVDLTSLSAAVDSSGDVTCNGLNNGFVAISVSGGTPAYSFDWSNNATTEDVTGLDGGTYSVSIADANGCAATLGPVTITEPAALVFTVDSVDNVQCFGGNNGAVFTTASGGTAPLLISWSNTATTEDISGLSQGTYTASVQDDNGCTANLSATVTQPTSALSASSTITNQVQGGALGSINVTITGGTAPYSSVWSNNATTEDISSLTAGVYTATITDANGCTTTLSDTVRLVTGISVIEGTLNLSLYPNPSQDKVYVELAGNHSADVLIEVLNVEGQLVEQYAANSGTSKLEMNFSNQAAGVYYARIRVDEMVATRKIVITR